MKLLYTVILLVVVIQMGFIKNSEAISSSRNTFTAKDKLWEFYNKELNLLSADTCVKFKNICEQLLNDKIIRAAATPLMQEFKRNMTHFQETYPFYKRYGLNEELVAMFSYMMDHYFQETSATQDSLYILQRLQKLNYVEICNEYESKFMEFVAKKLLPKFEELKNHKSNNKTLQWQELLKWASRIKECESYACFYQHYYSFYNVYVTPKQQLHEYIHQQLQEIYMFYCNNAINMIKGVLKSPKLTQLSPDLRQQFKQAIQDYINKYESNHNVDQLYKLLLMFDTNILLKFRFNKNIPSIERHVLMEIFDEQGFTQFELKYEKKFKDFLRHDFVKQFESLKAAFNQEELIKEKPMMDWFERYKGLSDYRDMVKAFDGLYKYI